jgi:hypothetical protein
LSVNVILNETEGSKKMEKIVPGIVMALMMIWASILAFNVQRVEAEDNLLLEMNVDQTTMNIGEKINITLTLRNVGETNVTVTFTPPLFDVYYCTPDGCFRWSDGMYFIQVVIEFTLETGQSHSETLQWDLYQYSHGQFHPPKPGTYNLSGLCYPAWTATQSSKAVTLIGIPGDLNADGTVELTDFYIACQAFLSKRGDPNWNMCCDLWPYPEGDGQVEMMDFYVLCQHYGEHR